MIIGKRANATSWNLLHPGGYGETRCLAKWEACGSRHSCVLVGPFQWVLDGKTDTPATID